MNKISSIKTKALSGPNGPASAVMIGIDVGAPQDMESFILEIGSTFTSQMLMSPEDTNMMLITIIGNCTAAEFKKHWDVLIANDPVIEYYMSTMQVADALHGTAEGQVLDQVSLIHAHDPAPREAQ